MTLGLFGSFLESLGRFSPLQRLPNLADVVFGALWGLTPHPKFQGWSGQRRVEIAFVSEMPLNRINIEIGGEGRRRKAHLKFDKLNGS